jgi:hypothetical protein
MNKTQKGALVSLVGVLLNIAVAVFLVVEIGVLKRLPESFSEKFWVLIAACVLGPILIIFYRKKQSSAEVESDERDNLIKKRAILVSFVSLWILLAALSIIPQLIVGSDGSIPVWLLSIMNYCVLLIAFLIHSIAILVQYGWRTNENE